MPCDGALGASEPGKKKNRRKMVGRANARAFPPLSRGAFKRRQVNFEMVLGGGGGGGGGKNEQKRSV